ncbi:diacylglycerol kinase family protein [Caproiciproducens galactitolivorans]|uniref:Diacylglycerol kinase family protein n=2 Tax=Caproiciproducens galactitolivorans TaxID=642589 RepID=A0ABT4BPC3_9FIRM|nr:diacylglycerol kinase family protein [Caproiciproducens galactitolivorans]MCY1712732.1 diacylglycerol kinase family protein [Caproiciproducens galactitolivorans]
MRFFKSFKYAFRGIVYCINNERNMRIHTVAALYVFVFSLFFKMSRTSYAAVFLAVAMVMAAELFNTVAEELCDMTAASFHPVVRIVKDMAAGAVLVCAVFAAAVGICVFWQPAAFLKILQFFAAKPLMLLLLAVSVAVSIVFIISGPIGIRDHIRRNREE